MPCWGFRPCGDIFMTAYLVGVDGVTLFYQPALLQKSGELVIADAVLRRGFASITAPQG